MFAGNANLTALCCGRIVPLAFIPTAHRDGLVTECPADGLEQAACAPNISEAADPDFQSVVDAHYPHLYRFALSLTRSESDARDLVQETFLVWARKGHQLQNPAKAKSWLFTTLHRRFLMTQKHSIRFPHFELCTADPELPKIEPASLDRLDLPKLMNCLGSLEPHHRAAVALFYLEDCSYLEIATTLAIPLGTVKSRIARGLEKLRELMTEALAVRPVVE